MPTFGVPQITLEGSRDQNLRGVGRALSATPVQSRVKTLLVIRDKDITIPQSIMAQFKHFFGVIIRAWKRSSHVYWLESMKLQLDALLGRDLLQGLLLENKTSHVVT